MSDTFRKEYKPLSDLQKDCIKAVKEKADELLKELETNNSSTHDMRGMALAKTNLEQCVMWAIKAITL